MVIVKVTSSSSGAGAGCVAARRRAARRLGREPGHQRPGAERRRRAHRAGADARQRRPALVGRRSEPDRRPTRSSAARTASRSSPMSAPSTARTARRSGGPSRWPCHASGRSRTCRPRTRRPTTSTPTPRPSPSTGRTTRARIVDFQPVEEATNQAVNGAYPTSAAADGGAVHPAGPLRLRRGASRSSTSATSTS